MKQDKFRLIMDMFAESGGMNLEQRTALSELIDLDNAEEIKNLRETAANTFLSKQLTEDEIYVPTEAVEKIKSRRQPRNKYKPLPIKT